MKTIYLTVLALFLAGATQINAQSILDRVDRTLNKVDRASNTVDRTERTGNRVKSIMGGNKSNGSSSKNYTTINIKGISLASLKTITANIKKIKGVSSTKMKYSAGSSSIGVSHNGSTDELLPSIQKVSSIFSDKNISSIDEKSISVKVK